MPSSTSNSDHGFAERDIPSKPWLAMFVAALVVVAVGLVLWERKVREIGYAPTINDSPNLWAQHRARAVGAKTDQIVLVGASRTLFDIDLDVVHEAFGGPMPIQLATVGSNPKVILADLAADPTYAGTTLVGIVPGLLAAGGGPPIATPTKYVRHYAKWSLADRSELPMALWLQERLAFLNASDLSLAALVDHGLDLPPRDGVYAPKSPRYLASLDRNRRARMADFVAKNPERLHAAQQIWIPLFNPPPKPSVFSEEEWAKLLADGLTASIESVVDSVRKIEARGGRVIFMRLPSTGPVLELEDRFSPRAATWDRLLHESGAPGVHFQDYVELQGFECPEWSHLGADDSVEFTRQLVRVLRRERLL